MTPLDKQVKPRALGRSSVQLFVAMAVVGGLAAFGTFNSIMNFPLVFGGICLALGWFNLWRNRATVRAAPWALLLLVGAALPVAGWLHQQNIVRESQARAQARTFELLGGTEAPALVGLEPLNTDSQALAAATSYAGPATIVAFWATWCSPCYVEMEELDELYRKHREHGLSVVAITRYGDSMEPEKRRQVRESSAKFARKRAFTFPVAITAEDDLYRAFQVLGIPRTVLVDGDGTIVGYAVGLDGARELMRKAEQMVLAPQGN